MKITKNYKDKTRNGLTIQTTHLGKTLLFLLTTQSKDKSKFSTKIILRFHISSLKIISFRKLQIRHKVI